MLLLVRPLAPQLEEDQKNLVDTLKQIHNPLEHPVAKWLPLPVAPAGNLILQLTDLQKVQGFLQSNLPIHGLLAHPVANCLPLTVATAGNLIFQLADLLRVEHLNQHHLGLDRRRSDQPLRLLKASLWENLAEMAHSLPLSVKIYLGHLARYHVPSASLHDPIDNPRHLSIQPTHLTENQYDLTSSPTDNIQNLAILQSKIS